MIVARFVNFESVVLDGKRFVKVDGRRRTPGELKFNGLRISNYDPPKVFAKIGETVI